MEVWWDTFYPIPQLKPVNSVTIKNLNLFYNSPPVLEKKIAAGIQCMVLVKKSNEKLLTINYY